MITKQTQPIAKTATVTNPFATGAGGSSFEMRVQTLFLLLTEEIVI